MAELNLQADNAGRDKAESTRWWDLPAVLLLLAAMFAAASRLEATHWSKTLGIIPSLALLGTLAGLAVGGSRFKSWIAALFCLAYGAYIICWQIGLTLSGSLPWDERLAALSRQAGAVINQMAQHQSVTNSILFILLMAILFWVLTFSAGYILIRHGNAWLAVLPMGLAIFTIHSFDPLISRRALYLTLFLFFGLVLVARAVYLQNRQKWQARHTALPAHHGIDFIRSGLITGGLIILVGWSVPTISQSIPVIVKATQPMRQTWKAIRARWQNAFDSLASTGTVYTEYYGPVLSLGRGQILRDTPMFTAKPLVAIPLGARIYWHAMAYNLYEDGQWTNEPFTNQAFDANSPLFLTEYLGRWQGDFVITSTLNLTTLYSPAQPISMLTKSRVKLANNPDGTVDIAGFEAEPPMRPGKAYTAQASIADTTVKLLRAGGVNYPQWVLDRYLQVPNSLTRRTAQLAKDITEGIDNPYDRAIAITNYLRESIVYEETVPNPPPGRDPIDWFLFDYKKGFCNYYATAEVMMLRSVGIPARLEAGYAQGELRQDGSYLVRQRDAHAWPEVYFPNVGWVEFEPTASQPEIIRFSGENSSTTAIDEAQAELEIIRRQQLEDMARQHELTPLPPLSVTRSIWPVVFTVMLVTLLPILVAWLILRRNRAGLKFRKLPGLLEMGFVKLGIKPPAFLEYWARRANLPPLTNSYHEINRALARLDEPAQSALTPAERAGKLGSLLPPANEPAQKLVSEYEIATFSTQIGDYNRGRQESRTIRFLSLKASIPLRLRQIRKLRLKKPSGLEP
jgi:hypothetical protein